MIKYKIIGAINLLLGGLQITYPLFVIFFIIPKLTTLYSEVGAEGPSNTPAYYVLAFIIFLGLANLFLGFKLFSKTEETPKKYLKYSLSLIIIPLILVIATIIIAWYRQGLV